MIVRTISPWAPAIGTVVFGTLFLLYSLVLFSDEAPSSTEATQAKVLWGTAAIVLVMAMLWSINASRVVLWDLYPELPSDQRRWVGVGAGAAIILLTAFSANRHFGSDASEILLSGIKAIPGVETLIFLQNIGGIIAIVFAVVACSLVSLGIEGRSVATLRERTNLYRPLLSSAAFLLAVGVYQIFRLAQLGAAFNTAHGVDALASSYSLAAGIVFSTLLITVFLPPAFRLEQLRISLIRVASRDTPKFDSETWSIRENLGAPPLQAFGSYAAVFLPTLVGLLTKLLQA